MPEGATKPEGETEGDTKPQDDTKPEGGTTPDDDSPLTWDERWNDTWKWPKITVERVVSAEFDVQSAARMKLYA